MSMRLGMTQWSQTTNLGVRGSNPFGRAIISMGYRPSDGALFPRGTKWVPEPPHFSVQRALGCGVLRDQRQASGGDTPHDLRAYDRTLPFEFEGACGCAVGCRVSVLLDEEISASPNIEV